MSLYEYKVVPAPKKGTKAKGVKTSADRFAYALQVTMNDMGADGWEYQRTDTLPCEERSGLTGRVTTFQNMLVFRRTLAPAEEAVEVVSAPVIAIAAPVAVIQENDAAVDAPDQSDAATPEVSAAQRVANTITPEQDVPHVDAKPLGTDPVRSEPRVNAD